MTPVEFVGIIHLLQTLLGEVVTAVNDPPAAQIMYRWVEQGPILKALQRTGAEWSLQDPRSWHSEGFKL